MRSYWKLFLGLLLLFAAVLIYTCGYMPAREEYLQERERLEESIRALQTGAIENSGSLEIRDKIPAERRALAEARGELYGQFPAEMKEEQQLMYAVYLEELFETEISFDFGEEEELTVLGDGAVFKGLNLTMKFPCGYRDFCRIVSYLEREPLAAVRSAAISYDSADERVEGTVDIVRYLILPENWGAQPNMAVPEAGGNAAEKN